MVTPARVAETLGGYRVMKKHLRTTERLHDHVRGGLPYTALLALAERLELPIGTLGSVLNISPRTLARRRRSRRLSPDESDRLARAARLLALAQGRLRGRRQAGP